MGTMKGLSSFQRDLLHIVAGMKKPYGLEVKDSIESYHEKEINHGRLYPNLDELAEIGLIEKGKIDDRTNYYQISKEGEKALRNRKRWEKTQHN